MIKLIAVCAALAAFVAVPAQAETSVTITLVGKTPSVIQREIYKAAKEVCRKDSPDELQACVDDTVDYAMTEYRLR